MHVSHSCAAPRLTRATHHAGGPFEQAFEQKRGFLFVARVTGTVLPGRGAFAAARKQDRQCHRRKERREQQPISRTKFSNSLRLDAVAMREQEFVQPETEIPAA